MKRILGIALLLALAAGVAAAQTAGTNTQARNGYYFSATTGARTNSSGSALIDDVARDRASYLSPTSIYNDTLACIESTAGDTTSIVDLSGYRTVCLMIQVTGGVASSEWRRWAVSARMNLGGASDSSSLFQLPIWGCDTLAANGRQVAFGTQPLAVALSDGEFLMTLTTTATTTADANLKASLPQGKVIPLTIAGGDWSYVHSASFRIRSIGQEHVVGGAGNPRPPRLRVWVFGTPL